MSSYVKGIYHLFQVITLICSQASCVDFSIRLQSSTGFGARELENWVVRGSGQVRWDTGLLFPTIAVIV